MDFIMKTLGLREQPNVHSRSFTARVHSLPNLSPSEQVSLLEGPLEKVLRLSSFDNVSIEARRDLLDLWAFLIDFVSEPAAGAGRSSRRDLGFLLMLRIVEREEFRLRGGNSKTGFLSTRDRYFSDHRRLAERTLELVSDSMESDLKTAELINFCAQMVASFFFQIPQIPPGVVDALHRKEQLRLLENDDDDDDECSSSKVVLDVTKEDTPRVHPRKRRSFNVADGESASASLDDKKSVLPHETQFVERNPSLFGWAHSGNASEKPLSPTVVDWLATKEAFFLPFLERFVLHVYAASSTKPVVWSVVPLYERHLLGAFFPLLKSAIFWDSVLKRSNGKGKGWVTSYPGYVRVKKTALACLRTNPMLLSKYVELTYECTNAHSLLSVDSCVEHLTLWFVTASTADDDRRRRGGDSMFNPPRGPESSVVDPSLRLPDDFKYDQFWVHFRVLLDSESFQILLKSLSFLYNVFHVFRGEDRHKLTGDLLNEFFFKLFLHWSTEVRAYMQHLLVYRVLRSDRRFLPCYSDTRCMKEFGIRKPGSFKIVRPKTQTSLLSAGPTYDSRADADGFVLPPTSGAEIDSFTLSSHHAHKSDSFERSSKSDDVSALNDIAHCSKIDAFVRMCLDGDVPSQNKAYLEASLRQYARVLVRYYRGVGSGDPPKAPVLAHRILLSEFTNA